MLFIGRKPICIVHQKLPNTEICFCGVKLKYLGGELVHPKVTKQMQLRYFKKLLKSGVY